MGNTLEGSPSKTRSQLFRKTRRLGKKEYVMNLSFENKVALVTGAASGMGLATAEAFAAGGAAVGRVDLKEGGGSEAGEILVARGKKGIAFVCVVREEARVKRLVEHPAPPWGRGGARSKKGGGKSPAVKTADATSE